MGKLIETLAARGRFGDTELAHITKEEGDLLQALGGARTINPDTGLTEYFDLMEAIGAGGSLLGGIGSLFGGGSQAKAAKKMAKTAQHQANTARMTLMAQLAKTIDPFGNVTEYIPNTADDKQPGVWQTTLEPFTRSLADASRQEEYQRLVEDLPTAREGRRANFDRRSDESNAAAGYLAQLTSPSPYSAEGLRGLLSSRALQGVDDAYRGTAETASRQAVRSGTGSGQMLADLAERRSQDTSRALQDAELAALTGYEDLEGGRTSRIGNLYNLLASRASNIDDVPFAPEQATGALSSQLQGQQRMLPYGAAMSGNLYNNAANLYAQSAKLGGSMIPGITAALPEIVNSGIDLWRALGFGDTADVGMDEFLMNRQLGDEYTNGAHGYF